MCGLATELRPWINRDNGNTDRCDHPRRRPAHRRGIAGLRTAPLAAGLLILTLTSVKLARVEPDAGGDERIPAGWMMRRPWRRRPGGH